MNQPNQVEVLDREDPKRCARDLDTRGFAWRLRFCPRPQRRRSMGAQRSAVREWPLASPAVASPAPLRIAACLPCPKLLGLASRRWHDNGQKCRLPDRIEEWSCLAHVSNAPKTAPALTSLTTHASRATPGTGVHPDTQNLPSRGARPRKPIARDLTHSPARGLPFPPSGGNTHEASASSAPTDPARQRDLPGLRCERVLHDATTQAKCYHPCLDATRVHLFDGEVS